ncbi:hypothetical protein [Clostridium beijerinckii]|uniref:Uncharacterized protein n=1 Tax=Clostridium beijerinckii TaxID=1520 RepID=A0AAX0B4U1_CLOBE|nr:hypothetical protein [Clostridium beijerinckii]NRT90097.1 hypothetical protein [Clostridium beijerinckii]NYC69627.1 hypothetical protein [Clostridium beijerinckii]
MTDIEVLNGLSIFIKNNIANEIKLEKPPEKGAINKCGSYELVNPSVYKGWMPLGSLNEYEYSIPSIVVMIDEGVDDNSDSNLSMRLKIVTFDPGETQEDGIVNLNGKGYMDLLNLITKIRLEFAKNPIILEKVNINKPIKWSMDSQQSYPYWTANISFTVSIASLPFNIKDDFL